MMGALAVCERDIRKFIKQPAVMAASIMGPLLTLILLGSAYGGAITHVPVAVVRESYGPFTSKFVDILRNEQSCAFGGINCQNSFQLYDVAVIDTAQEMLREGRVKGIVHIPLGFDRSLSDKVNVIVTVSLDNTDPLSAASIGAEVAQAAQQLSSQIQISTANGSIITADLENYYRNVLYNEFMAPGTFVQSIMFVSIIAGGVQLVVDKERGIIEGYLVTPLKKYEIIVGVLLSGVIKALFTSIATFVLAIVIVGIRPNLDILGITLTIFTLSLTSLGLIAMMTAYAVRSSSADVYRVSSFPINLTLYYTSGAVYPLEGFPTWMKDVSMINPETYSVHALRLLMYKGAGFQAVAGDFAFLAVFSALMLALAIVVFKRGL
ncbi:MAG: ABC transporter permease [Candidatus Bathyarchaeia archaeon]